MTRALVLCVLIACKREEDPSQTTAAMTTTTATSAPAQTNAAGPTQLVALTQPTDSTSTSASASAPPTATLTPAASAPPATRTSSVVIGAVTASGLTSESVKHVFQKNVVRYQSCYDAGLRGNPALRGRVVARITIDASGAIASAEDAGSDLADGTVTSCVFGTFGKLVFPEPEGDSATATVPIIFSPPP